MLPKVAGVTDDFFSTKSTFSLMKQSAVFMNIGRGTTVNEDDLIEALNTKMISGAVLDVYKYEPLDPSNGLWSCENVLMTPHCADQDSTHLHRALGTLAANLENWNAGGPEKLTNVCDKSKGY